MKIAQLELYNIGVHQKTLIQPAKVTLITGPNDSGKTTIANAIEAALTGRYTTSHGNARVDQLANGEGEIILTLEDGRRVIRSTSGALDCDWLPRGSARVTQTELERLMGCPLDRARLALSGQRFWRLEPKEQKALLQDIMGIALTAQQIEDRLTELGGPDLVATAKRISPRLEYISRAYTSFFDERTVAKRKLKELLTLTEDTGQKFQEQVYLSEQELSLREKQVKSLEEQCERLLVKLGQARAQNDRAQTLRLLISKLCAQEPPATEASEDGEEALHRRIQDCKARLDALTKERDHSMRLANQIATNQAQLEKLQSAQSCWKCGEPSQAVIQERDRLTTEIAMLQESAQGLQDLPTLEARIQKGKAKVAELNETLADAYQARSLVQKRQQWEKQLEQAKADLEKLVEDCQPVEDLEKKLSEARDALALAKRDVIDGQASRAALAAHSANQEALTQTQALVDHLETLVPWFSPNGFQLEYARQQIGGFEGMVNQILAHFDLSGSYNADLVFQIGRGNNPAVSYQQAADSAYILSGFAHQVVFAQVTGLGLILVDRLEALWPERQVQLLNYCQNHLPEGVDNVFLFGAIEQIQVPEGVAHIQLEAP